jgi:hypothetical protein
LGLARLTSAMQEGEKIVVDVSSRYRDLARALLVTTVLAVGLASVAAAPADAEGFEVYSCKSCSNANGAEVYAPTAMNAIGRVEGATGVCAAVWQRLGGGKWREFLECTATGTETKVATGFIGPLEGHGQVRRYYAKFLYNLWGQEGWI